MVDSWDYGGYLMWRYPQLDLLTHGYGDTFTSTSSSATPTSSGSRPAGTPSCAYGLHHRSAAARNALAYALDHQEHWTVLRRSPGVAELRAPPGWSTAG